MRVDSIGQPTIKTTRQAIEGILSYDNFDDLGVAASYITSSGLFDTSCSRGTTKNTIIFRQNF